MDNPYDIAIIGGGIVGLATARALGERTPGARLVILEKEAKLATHQTGNNSGVIHSGIYYKPGSYKAKLCVEGKGLMLEFCQKHGIRVDHVGKVIVATSQAELPRLQTLYERGVANGVPVEMLEPAQLREIEPHAAALRAIRSPSTAIVDYKEVCAAMTRELTARGVVIETGARVTSIARTAGALDIVTPRTVVRARRLVNCAGLYSDVVARMAGARVDVRIIPFRGEYYMIRPERQDIVRGLIYPVPDPEFPFLGVHLTRTVHGEVEAGPNAVLAFAREGYRFGRVSPSELAGTLAYRGFWQMARRYWRMGSYEMYRSLSKDAFVRALQRLVPILRSEDVTRGGAGVRAQAVSPDGSLVDDFRIVAEADAIHVLNAPSPGATASLAIGRHIAGLAVDTFGLK
ncbi:MAG: hydroxyglutarate oxidase [Candidatus Rokubacteria bacterium 13_1_40CM_2_68_8]|nr:MAG: hydroxyglutarate oxidase [Candidatus Rokubacteria bacterium 13_1_40CM_2_68_8]PYN75324.1 MAG: L-2-hydroxyglutarate oxidase [Candidatus Rokubacteria bacterium]